jgi:hypothetical protein
VLHVKAKMRKPKIISHRLFNSWIVKIVHLWLRKMENQEIYPADGP